MNLQEELKALKERIAELEEQAKEEQEFPKNYDDYWYIDTTGDILNENWHGFGFEEAMLEIGNVFRTKEQAEFAIEKLKVEAELRKFSRPFEMLSTNWLITRESNGDIEANWSSHVESQGTLYFDSEDEATKAIRSVGEERIKKYIFEVED